MTVKSDQDPHWFGSLDPDTDMDPHWDKKLEPYPHWNQFKSTTLVNNQIFYVYIYIYKKT